MQSSASLTQSGKQFDAVPVGKSVGYQTQVNLILKADFVGMQLVIGSDHGKRQRIQNVDQVRDTVAVAVNNQNNALRHSAPPRSGLAGNSRNRKPVSITNAVSNTVDPVLSGTFRQWSLPASLFIKSFCNCDATPGKTSRITSWRGRPAEVLQRPADPLLITRRWRTEAISGAFSFWESSSAVSDVPLNELNIFPVRCGWVLQIVSCFQRGIYVFSGDLVSVLLLTQE
jgi:hypothetical protein